MVGDIMNISRLRLGTDGEGITTLVTFFDCPLHCRYCINRFCHKNEYSGRITRGDYTPEELLRVFKKDEIYYRMSGGGVTFGGGEPLLQSLFIHEVCKLCDQNWQMRIETSLNVPWKYVEPVIEDMDQWIIDIKDINHQIYKDYTSVSIDNLIGNILRLRDLVDKSKFHIRIPRIPGFNNEEDIEKSVGWVKSVLDIDPEIFDYVKPAFIENNYGIQKNDH